MRHLNFDTNNLRDRKELAASLAELCVVHPNGCLMFPSTSMSARLSGYHDRRAISPARVAWALAHPEDHLGVNDYAIHLCYMHWDLVNRTVCCHPEHLKKGNHADMHIMIATRARHLVLQGAV